MKRKICSVLLICVGLVTMFNLTHCTVDDSSNCKIDSLAVYNDYRKGHFDRLETKDGSKDTLLDLVSILQLFKDNSKSAVGDGEPVEFSKADICTTAYKNLMNRLGFPDTDPANPSDIGKLTLSEAFKGDGLIEWLKAAKDSGATEIDLRFGKYNSNFLTWRFPRAGDAVEARKRMGRLTIFLYPVRVEDKTFTLVGKDAYDLGNLRP